MMALPYGEAVPASAVAQVSATTTARLRGSHDE